VAGIMFYPVSFLPDLKVLLTSTLKSKPLIKFNILLPYMINLLPAELPIGRLQIPVSEQ
jgi:hypothetical protein